MRWILDNGHGISTKGKRGTKLKEWKFNREVVRYLSIWLDKHNIDYQILVPELNDIPLKERKLRIDGDILISIHGNAFSDPKVSGLETWYHREDSLELARIFQQELCKELKWNNRGVKKGNFSMIKTKIPSILTENGFYTNPREQGLMLYKPDRIAKAHLKAIIRYEKIQSKN